MPKKANDIPEVVEDEAEQPVSDYAAWVPEALDADELAELEEAQYYKTSVPVIQEVLDWYDECIDKFSRPDVITGVNVSTPAEDVKKAVLHAQQQIASYREKKKQFIHRFKDYIQEGGAEE